MGGAGAWAGERAGWRMRRGVFLAEVGRKQDEPVLADGHDAEGLVQAAYELMYREAGSVPISYSALVSAWRRTGGRPRRDRRGPHGDGVRGVILTKAVLASRGQKVANLRLSLSPKSLILRIKMKVCSLSAASWAHSPLPSPLRPYDPKPGINSQFVGQYQLSGKTFLVIK